jgi:hypothetical protein
MRMEEWKVQVTDTALYDKEHKKGPRDVDISWAIGKFFFLVQFIFLLLTKILMMTMMTTLGQNGFR